MLIGNTPMIKINYEYKNQKKYIFAKLEWYSITGSIKDRIAYYILNKAKSENSLAGNQTIVEATSGNTGLSLASIGAALNHKVVIFMPDFLSKERINLLKLYGAELHLVSRENGGFQKCIELAKEYAEINNAYLFNQFSNQDNIEAHYNTTAKEIHKQVPNIDAFISGIGSGGTLMGIAKYFKENKKIKTYLLEPLESPLISKNKIGIHKLQGIGDDFIPNIVNEDYIDDFICISSDEAINMCKKILKELGLGIGLSSAANFLASIKAAEKHNNVVTIFADDIKKYLSNLNYNEKKDFISNEIKLINYEIVK